MTTAFTPRWSVYLVQHGELFKIGRSTDPRKRLSQVAPRSAKLLHHFLSLHSPKVERALHRRFAHCRIPELGHEWFRLTLADVVLLCALGRTDHVDDLPPELQPPPPDVTLYAEIPLLLKAWLDEVAQEEGRKLNAQLVIILQEVRRQREAQRGGPASQSAGGDES